MIKVDKTFISNSRKRELEQLLNIANIQENCFLIGEKRSGKSFLLDQLKKELQDKDVQVLIINLEHTIEIGDFTNKFISSVYNHYQYNSHKLDILNNLLSPFRPKIKEDLHKQFSVKIQFFDSAHAITIFSSLLKSLMDNEGQMIIGIDNIEQLLRLHHSDHFKSIIQELSSLSNCNFLFTSYKPDFLTSPIGNLLKTEISISKVITLKKSTKKELLEYIQQYFLSISKKITEEATKEIVSWTRCEIYFTLKLIKILSIEHKDEIVLSDVIRKEDTLVSIYKGEFHTICDLLTKNQLKLLIAISKEEKLLEPTSNRFRQDHNLGAASSVNLALQSLMDKHMIVIRSKAYKVQNILLSRYLENL